MGNQIVLIIGAGASNALHPQFALGGELLQQISDRVTDRTSVYHPYLSTLLKKLEFDYSTLWDFVHHLDEYKSTAEFPSIDGFLDEVSSYPEFHSVKAKFVQIGKFSIMFHILGYEAEIKNPKSGGLKDDAWIHEVAKFIDEKNLLNDTASKGFDLKIITFNYDRNIEHFLYNHSRFENKKEEIKLFIEKSVTHVYGKIGDLKWQNNGKYFDFGEDNNKADKIFDEKNAIDIMYLDRMNKSTEENKKAVSWIHSEETKKVCAFGFNFDLINYRLLALQNLGIVVPKLKFIANVYPNDPNGFTNRRTMANRIRNIKHNAEITYLGCADFLKEVLNHD
jgi:hypothetical protein